MAKPRWGDKAIANPPTYPFGEDDETFAEENLLAIQNLLNCGPLDEATKEQLQEAARMFFAATTLNNPVKPNETAAACKAILKHGEPLVEYLDELDSVTLGKLSLVSQLPPNARSDDPALGDDDSIALHEMSRAAGAPSTPVNLVSVVERCQKDLALILRTAKPLSEMKGGKKPRKASLSEFIVRLAPVYESATGNKAKGGGGDYSQYGYEQPLFVKFVDLCLKQILPNMEAYHDTVLSLDALGKFIKERH